MVVAILYILKYLLLCTFNYGTVPRTESKILLIKLTYAEINVKQKDDKTSKAHVYMGL